MLTSHAAASAGEIGCPKCGASAAVAAPAWNANATTTAASLPAIDVSYVDIGHLAFGTHAPTGDQVAMLHWECVDIRRVLGRPALSNECGPARLKVSGLVGGAAHQDRWAAVPVPRHAEAGQRLRQHRRLQGRERPA